MPRYTAVLDACVLVPIALADTLLRVAEKGLYRLWVPEILSPHATWEYSWIRPPSRSRRRTRTLGPRLDGCSRPAGGLCRSARCGR